MTSECHETFRDFSGESKSGAETFEDDRNSVASQLRPLGLTGSDHFLRSCVQTCWLMVSNQRLVGQ